MCIPRYNEDNRKGSVRGISNLEVFFATVKLIKESRKLFLIPIMLWIGMEEAFITADFNESFVSCASGAKIVGLVMICYGITSTIPAILVGFLESITGQPPIMGGAALLQVAIFVTLLFWSPSTLSSPVPAIIAGLLGGGGGGGLRMVSGTSS
ncbi:hypothetical protein PR048_005909 [Dryococelus australis]|uniref:Uncharacterized protein n=1 Tax=Dryococelus australis TaxID=614101 RepID=A0ABQ9IBN6_9NEOP|nr:hypothetical protein PR048_005909 [Dryococelus australis]